MFSKSTEKLESERIFMLKCICLVNCNPVRRNRSRREKWRKIWERGEKKNEEKLFFKTPKGIEFRYLTLLRAHGNKKRRIRYLKSMPMSHAAAIVSLS